MNTIREKNVNRIKYIDVAKGLGMLCIIVGHSKNDFVMSIVFTFHVPLFFLISGYFISEKESIKDFVTKKIRYLIFPYFIIGFWIVIISMLKELLFGNRNYAGILVDTILSVMYGSGTEENIKLFGIASIGAIWFLLALFWALVIVKISLKSRYTVWIIFLIAIISYVTSKYIWLPFGIQAGGTAAIFVYIAVCMRKKNWELKGNLVTFVIGVVCLIIEVLFGISVNIVNNYYGLYGISIIGAFFISTAVLYVSYYLCKFERFSSFFVFWGENSVIILGFHLIEMTFIDYNEVQFMILNYGVSKMISLILILFFKLSFIALGTAVVLQIRKVKYLLRGHCE